MDAENERHKSIMVEYFREQHRTIPNRGDSGGHLHLHQLRRNMGPALHRHPNQRIHTHQVVGIRPVSNRDIGSRRERQRAILRVVGLRTDVDAEARFGLVVGRYGVGDGGGDDGDDDTYCHYRNPYPFHRLRQYIQRSRRNHPFWKCLLALHRRHKFSICPNRGCLWRLDLPLIRHRFKLDQRGHHHRRKRECQHDNATNLDGCRYLRRNGNVPSNVCQRRIYLLFHQ